MIAPPIKTGSWFSKLPPNHAMIGISRGQPRGRISGYRMFRKLAPGPWFKSVSVAEYERLYRKEVLGPLRPRDVAEQLAELAGGRIPVIVCFERVGDPIWCHRALAAEWLAEGLGGTVPEFGHEHLPQHEHPLMHVSLRRAG